MPVPPLMPTDDRAPASAETRARENAKLSGELHALLHEETQTPEHTIWDACCLRDAAERIVTIILAEVTALRAQLAEVLTPTPVRTGCDDCLEARRVLEVQLTQARDALTELREAAQEYFIHSELTTPGGNVDASVRLLTARNAADDVLALLAPADPETK